MAPPTRNPPAPPAQSPPTPQLDLAGELAKAQAEIAALREELSALRPSKELPEKYRGTKSYRVGAGGAYRKGRMYAAGDIITVTDEAPSRTWTPVVDSPADEKPVEQAKTRASDLSL